MKLTEDKLRRIIREELASLHENTEKYYRLAKELEDYRKKSNYYPHNMKEELSQTFDGYDTHAIYKMPGNSSRVMKALMDGFHPSNTGEKVIEGDPQSLRQWAKDQGWSKKPSQRVEQDVFTDKNGTLYVLDERTIRDKAGG